MLHYYAEHLDAAMHIQTLSEEKRRELQAAWEADHVEQKTGSCSKVARIAPQVGDPRSGHTAISIWALHRAGPIRLDYVDGRESVL